MTPIALMAHELGHGAGALFHGILDMDSRESQSFAIDLENIFETAVRYRDFPWHESQP